MRVTIESLQEKIRTLEAAVAFNKAPDDAEFGPGHPVFEVAAERDEFRRLLLLYMALIRDCESIDFLDLGLQNVTVGAEDLTKLRIMSNQSRLEYPL